MSNILKKIEKNRIKNIPIMITQRELINKENEIRKNLEIQYRDKLQRMSIEMHKEIRTNTSNVIDTISVEFLYELATQMNYFNCEDEEIKKQIQDRVQDIYSNTMKAISKYSKYKRPVREFKKRKNKIENDFNIVF